MYALDRELGEYFIYRLMVGAAWQGKGYGRAALRAMLEEIRKDPEHHVCLISFEPENRAAERLYASEGFRPDGRVFDGEFVYVLEY